MYNTTTLLNALEGQRLTNLSDKLFGSCKNLNADVKVPLNACFRYRFDPSYRVEEYLDNIYKMPNGKLVVVNPGDDLDEIRERLAKENNGKEVKLSRYYHKQTFMKRSGGVNQSSKKVRMYALSELRENLNLNNTDYYKISALMRLQFGRDIIAPDTLGEYKGCETAVDYADEVVYRVRECLSLTKSEQQILDYVTVKNATDVGLMERIWNVNMYDDKEKISEARNKMQICIKRFIEKAKACTQMTDDTYYALLALLNFDFFRRGMYVPE